MIRIGHAWDTHKLVKNRKLILGGILIESNLGLLGHSDADVVLHSISEAFLGSLSLGDLGTIFPDTCESNKDLDSKKILDKCYNLVKEHGFILNNLDVTIYSENIKIAPVRKKIKTNIAKLLQVDDDQISIKATTYEKMSFIGRGEAIACECVLLISKA